MKLIIYIILFLNLCESILCGKEDLQKDILNKLCSYLDLTFSDHGF